jgi:hypothetical protein
MEQGQGHKDRAAAARDGSAAGTAADTHTPTLSEMVESAARKPSGQNFHLLASERPSASSGAVNKQQPCEQQAPVHGAFSSNPHPNSA